MIAVLGAGGQVGSALLACLGSRAQGFDQADADLSQPESALRLLEKLKPEAVINAAAYTQVDKAESDERLAHLLNAEVPGILARFCAEHSIPFLHYSTDYVFDGSGSEPRREDAPTAPLGAYGRTKLEGERRVLEARGKAYVVRTSWVHAARGANFVRTMLKKGCELPELRVVADQRGAPTFARHLAQESLRLMQLAPAGVYHLCNSGETSWHDFAEAIFADARVNAPANLRTALKIATVTAIASSEYTTPARRPLNSRLDCSKAAALGVRMPTWQEGLDECLGEIYSAVRNGEDSFT